MSERRRPTSTATERATATCRQCAYSSDALNALGNAARHHDATGHTVTTVITRAIVYGDPLAQHPDQGDLFTPHNEAPA